MDAHGGFLTALPQHGVTLDTTPILRAKEHSCPELAAIATSRRLGKLESPRAFLRKYKLLQIANWGLRLLRPIRA